MTSDDDPREGVLPGLVLEVSTLLMQMRLGGVHDPWASFQLLTLWLAYVFDVAACRALRAKPRPPHEAPAARLAHLRRLLHEGRGYQQYVIDLWADLDHRGVPPDAIPDLLLEAADRVLVLRVEGEALDAMR
ncbi:MAG: hypothetical protein HY553_16730 [Elusimicrobia bacterium]|nr:hypothetical protein [Elusimicrobiota bacterium]